MGEMLKMIFHEGFQQFRSLSGSPHDEGCAYNIYQHIGVYIEAGCL